MMRGPAVRHSNSDPELESELDPGSDPGFPELHWSRLSDPQHNDMQRSQPQQQQGDGQDADKEEGEKENAEHETKLDQKELGSLQRRRGREEEGKGGDGDDNDDGTTQTPSPHISPPSIPSPMSVGHFGLTPLTPLGQHLLASLARSNEQLAEESGRDDVYQETGAGRAEFVSGTKIGFSKGFGGGDSGNDDHDNRDPTQGSRDALIQRLSELAFKLSRHDESPDPTALEYLHGSVDEMDRLVAGRRPSSQLQLSRENPSSSNGDERFSGYSSPMPMPMPSPSPSLSSSWMRSRFSDLSLSTKRDSPQQQRQAGKLKGPVKRRPAVNFFKIASEAEKLNAQLETLTRNLQARQEESEHIHQLLVTRAERAAQRILFLQSRVAGLEAELRESDADLSHLRLSLKAVEVLCPPDALTDEDLARSIANWKRDYAVLKRRRAQRRRKMQGGFDFEEGTSEGAVRASPLGMVDSARESHWGAVVCGSEMGSSYYAAAHGESSFGTPRTADSRHSWEESGASFRGEFETPSPVSRRTSAFVHSSHQEDHRHRGGETEEEQPDEETLTPRSARSSAAINNTNQVNENAPPPLLSPPPLSRNPNPRPSGAARTLNKLTHYSRPQNGTPPSRKEHLDSPRLVDVGAFGPPLLRRSGSGRAATPQRGWHHLQKQGLSFEPDYKE